MNTKNTGSNSVVTGVRKEYEDRSSGPAVLVPLTTDTNTEKTTMPNGMEKKKVILPLRKPVFSCEDIREKKRRLALQAESSVSETCVPRETTAQLNTGKGLLKDVDETEVIMITIFTCNMCGNEFTTLGVFKVHL